MHPAPSFRLFGDEDIKSQKQLSTVCQIASPEKQPTVVKIRLEDGENESATILTPSKEYLNLLPSPSTSDSASAGNEEKTRLSNEKTSDVNVKIELEDDGNTSATIFVSSNEDTFNFLPSPSSNSATAANEKEALLSHKIKPVTDKKVACSNNTSDRDEKKTVAKPQSSLEEKITLDCLKDEPGTHSKLKTGGSNEEDRNEIALSLCNLNPKSNEHTSEASFSVKYNGTFCEPSDHCPHMNSSCIEGVATPSKAVIAGLCPDGL